MKRFMKLGGYSETKLNFVAMVILSIKLDNHDEIKSNE